MAKKIAPSTQRHLDISSIREGVVLMKDGTLRAVLMVSSINFALKSEDEQNALIQNYVSFLNILEYPLQIVIQSRKMNIEPYLNQLKEQEAGQSNELLKEQIADYRGFVTDLVELGEIMQKRFYVVLPYDPITSKKKSFWTRTKDVLGPAKLIKLKETQFLERKKDLQSRVDKISGNLQSLGLKVVQLDTQGLIELYYNSYNPVISQTQELAELEEVSVEPEAKVTE